MTTIAWDGKTVAADSRVTRGDHVIPGEANLRKIIHLRDGSVFAGSGVLENINLALNWIEDGMPERKPTIKEAMRGFVVNHDGEVFEFSEALILDRCYAPFFAIGSGDQYALAAMHLGCDARRAVEVAATFDTGTGGEIVCMVPEHRKVRAKRKLA